MRSVPRLIAILRSANPDVVSHAFAADCVEAADALERLETLRRQIVHALGDYANDPDETALIFMEKFESFDAGDDPDAEYPNHLPMITVGMIRRGGGDER